MNTGDMPPEIVLATESTSTRTMMTDKGFNPVGVVGIHVGFEIECPVKRTRTHGTLEFLAVPFTIVMSVLREGDEGNRGRERSEVVNRSRGTVIHKLIEEVVASGGGTIVGETGSVLVMLLGDLRVRRRWTMHVERSWIDTI
jgi:hypothetical protein